MVSFKNKGDFWGCLFRIEILTVVSMYNNIFWDTDNALLNAPVCMNFPCSSFCSCSILLSHKTLPTVHTTLWAHLYLPLITQTTLFSCLLSFLHFANVALFRDSTCYPSPIWSPFQTNVWTRFSTHSSLCLLGMLLTLKYIPSKYCKLLPMFMMPQPRRWYSFFLYHFVWMITSVLNVIGCHWN